MNTNTHQRNGLTAPQPVRRCGLVVGIVWAVVAWDIISTLILN